MGPSSLHRLEPLRRVHRVAAPHASAPRPAGRALPRVLLTLALVCLGAWLGPLGVPGQAAAQDVDADSAQARASFEAGRDAYDRGRFAEALRNFENAYELSGRPKLLFNIARAAESEGLRQRAIETYTAYLRNVPEADNREFVEARLAKLRADEAAHAPMVTAPVVAAPAAAPAPAAAAPVIPSPSETAALSIEPAPAPGPRADGAEARPFWKKGWFWGVVGVAVAGAVTAAIVLSIDKDAPRVSADEHISTLGVR